MDTVSTYFTKTDGPSRIKIHLNVWGLQCIQICRMNTWMMWPDWVELARRKQFCCIVYNDVKVPYVPRESAGSEKIKYKCLLFSPICIYGAWVYALDHRSPLGLVFRATVVEPGDADSSRIQYPWKRGLFIHLIGKLKNQSLQTLEVQWKLCAIRELLPNISYCFVLFEFCPHELFYERE